MPPSLPAIRVNQWLAEWDRADFDANAGRRKPDPYFYILSVPGRHLRRLCGIYPRVATSGQARSLDSGIQRRHIPERSDEIAHYLRRGFPWSSLSTAKRASGDFDDLIKPGWLPTGIVVNVLHQGDKRRGRVVDQNDLIRINPAPADDASAMFQYPTSFTENGWEPQMVPPLEVIDGQHRLWAFDEDSGPENFELPVIAFSGLDIGWQAYLFYTINIKPKRINQSLAFDLYPLLRTADWLARAEGHQVYRETRAQELVEALWANPGSPWHDRIDMLGDQGRRMVSQAAWVRSLTASMIKSFHGRGVAIGGLFGGESGDREPALAWSRAQQAAFLIYSWRSLYHAVEESTDDWAIDLRGTWQREDGYLDPAFAGSHSLLNTDQGVRGVLQVVNDVTMVRLNALQLADWSTEDLTDAPTDTAVTEALRDIESQPVGAFLDKLAQVLAMWDWRSASATGLSLGDQQAKMRFRGGSGYREIRLDLLKHVASRDATPVSAAASDVLAKIE
jgi:hypothetical protein